MLHSHNRILAFFFFFYLSGFSFAQSNFRCATDEMVSKSLSGHEEKLKSYYKHQSEINDFDKEQYKNAYASSKVKSTLYLIPTVVHIIHENGPENVSDAQVMDAIRVLNNDFRKLNNDTTQIVSSFQSIAADCGIEFRLAQIDPNGNCTNGIDRIYSSQTNIGDDGSKLNPWPEEKYYNIWVVKNISPGGIAGYAYYPGTAPAGAEGVIILHNYLGSIGTSSINNSRVLTHETGHYLDLAHVWGSTNNPGVACGDDGVSDTPITKGWTSCNINGSICSPGTIENVQNYMEYSYCNNMFSWGQKSRMIAALNSWAGSRNTLWILPTLQSTGISAPVSLCAADFTAYPHAATLCAGESITFRDASYNARPTSWLWSFPGGTLVGNSLATDSMPQVNYAVPGQYDVSLTVSNSTSTVSITKTNYILVNSSTAVNSSNSYAESFETVQILGTDWQVNDLDGSNISWQISSSAASSGQQSAFISNISANAGDADELISPSLNIANIANPYFSFKYAFASKNSPATDKLLVLVSPDCGKNWYQRKLITGVNLETAPNSFSPFFPNASQWKTSVVSILNMLNQSNVRIKFKFIGGGGNNVYIDDISIVSALGIDESGPSNQFAQLSPNPILEFSKLSFFLKRQERVRIEITDLLGRKISVLADKDFLAGSNELMIAREEKLSSGLYLLQIYSASGWSVLKFAVD